MVVIAIYASMFCMVAGVLYLLGMEFLAESIDGSNGLATISWIIFSALISAGLLTPATKLILKLIRHWQNRTPRTVARNWVDQIPRWASVLMLLGLWQFGQIISGAINSKYHLYYDEMAGAEAPLVVVKSDYWGFVTEERRARLKPVKIGGDWHYELEFDRPGDGGSSMRPPHQIEYSNFLNPPESRDYY